MYEFKLDSKTKCCLKTLNCLKCDKYDQFDLQQIEDIATISKILNSCKDFNTPTFNSLLKKKIFFQ